MSEFEKKLLERIEKLERENKKLNGIEESKIPTYQYSKITDTDLRKIVEIKRSIKDEILNTWLNNAIVLEESVINFLSSLIDRNKKLIQAYKEEDLKIKFITPMLNKINFLSYENEFRDFYEEPLFYENDEFIFNGTTDFLISRGLFYSERPYFFIQEFKKGKTSSDPEPQLLAELISAIELNNWKTIKGAYIIGASWNFVILNKFKKHDYEYFVSKTYNSANIEDLKDIFRNLLFVKEEITDMVKRGV